jgi:hypothetical protein
MWTNPDLKQIGFALDGLVKLRNRASYSLNRSPQFASDIRAHGAIQQATTVLALLDVVDTDPTRRAAAINAIRP